MNAELIHNQKLIESYFNDVWNKGELELLDTLITEDYINHSPSAPNPKPGPEGLKPIILEMRKGIPDLHYEIKDLVITQNKIVAKTVVTGTHTGELWGIKPEGKRIEVDQINIEYVKNGKISEHWRITDELKMMKQLGLT
jgi:steroid delta-isomerase-like uncharacterized protein